jgi:hypothetical protein
MDGYDRHNFDACPKYIEGKATEARYWMQAVYCEHDSLTAEKLERMRAPGSRETPWGTFCKCHPRPL